MQTCIAKRRQPQERKSHAKLTSGMSGTMLWVSCKFCLLMLTDDALSDCFKILAILFCFVLVEKVSKHIVDWSEG